MNTNLQSALRRQANLRIELSVLEPINVVAREAVLEQLLKVADEIQACLTEETTHQVLHG